MIKIITVSRCKCEKCDQTVDCEDKYCSECGNNLKDKISFEEIPKFNVR